MERVGIYVGEEFADRIVEVADGLGEPEDPERQFEFVRVDEPVASAGSGRVGADGGGRAPVRDGDGSCP